MSIVIPFDSRTRPDPNRPNPHFERMAADEAKAQLKNRSMLHFDRPITEQMLKETDTKRAQPSGRREAEPTRELPTSD